MSQQRRNSRRAMTETHSPYNFVPHTREVVIPGWEDDVSHGRPFKNGISGSLKVKLVPQTPLIVADREEPRSFQQKSVKARTHFRHANGLPGIPGSSLRGMLRSVVEIVTHSKLSKMNDFYFGVRDLHNPELYGKHMAQIVDRQPTPLVNAGWLRPNTGDDAKDYPAILFPCDYAKVEYSHIQRHGDMCGVSNYNPGRKQSAVKKYQSWIPRGEFKIPWKDRMKVKCSVDKTFSKDSYKGVPLVSAYHRLTTELGRGQNGYLVFTGQPANYDPEKPKRKGAGNPKHHDFIFMQRSLEYSEGIKIPKKVFNGFITAHSATGQQHKMTDSHNEELTFWMAQSEWAACEKGIVAEAKELVNEIPVFFLMRKNGAKDDLVRSIGLAQMFRLAYDYTTQEMAPQTWKQNGEEVADTETSLPFDMSELMFGTIHENPNRDTGKEGFLKRRMLKGRVQIGHAHFVGTHKPNPLVKAVLGGPKASFYPYYIEQGSDDRRPGSVPKRDGTKPVYKTYMDAPTVAQIRGYKRYVIRPDVVKPVLPEINGKVIDNDKVVTYFEPISTNGFFETSISIHNLRPEEVGALIWALTFGGRENTMHQIGMAKSLGYGAVKVEIAGNDLFSLSSLLMDGDASAVDLEVCMDAFVDYMDAQVTGWSSSRRIYELMMMATPLSQDESQKAQHPLLSHPEYGNMFAGTKKAGLTLRPRGSEMGFLEWSAEKRAKLIQAQEEARAQKAAADAAAAAAAEEAERARLEAMTNTERAKDRIEANMGTFKSGPWYDWMLGTGSADWIADLPAFTDLEDTQSLMTWLNQELDLWKMRSSMPGYANNQKQEILATLRQYVPKEQAKSSQQGAGSGSKTGISNKEMRKLSNKNEKTQQAAAKRILDALNGLNVKKKDALKALTAMQKSGHIEPADLNRLRAHYDAQQD